MDGTVLLADDDRTIRTVLTQALTRAGAKVHATGSLITLMRWIDEGRGDLVITDIVMPDGNGLKSVPLIRERRPDLPVIVISAQNTLMTAIQAEEADAWDYLPKPFDLPDLMGRVAKGLRRGQGRETARSRKQGGDTDLALIGSTPVMQALFRTVARVLNADLPVLVSGESGTGKTALAGSLHASSDRRSRPLVVIGPDTVVADTALGDMLDRARGGTVLIEDVGAIDAAAQARLARAIEAAGEGQGRIIATATRDAEGALVGDIRPDLLYRLNAIEVHIPALRDRSADVPLLADALLARAAQDLGEEVELDTAARQVLQGYDWPGNVRQLDNVVRRLAITATARQVGGAAVRAVLAESLAAAGDGGGRQVLSEAVERHVRDYFDRHGAALPPVGVYMRVLREIERPLIEVALEATGGNQARCADLLGINRNTLRKKIRDLEIEVTRRRRLM